MNGQRTYADSVGNNEALKNHLLTCQRFIAAASYVVHFPSFSENMRKDISDLGLNRYVGEYLSLNEPWTFVIALIGGVNIDISNTLQKVFNALTEDLDQEALTIHNRVFVQKIQGTLRERYQFDKMDKEIKSLFQKSPLYQTSKEFAVDRYCNNTPETAAIVYCRNGMIVRFKKGGGTVITGGSFVLSGCGFTIGRNKTLEENIEELERTVGVQSVQRF